MWIAIIILLFCAAVGWHNAWYKLQIQMYKADKYWAEHIDEAWLLKNNRRGRHATKAI